MSQYVNPSSVETEIYVDYSDNNTMDVDVLIPH